MMKLFGDTYPHKDTIKSYGGKWNAQVKSWFVPEDQIEHLTALCSRGEDKARPSDELNLSGQLWENCDICGEDPIYISHGVCETCAKKGKIKWNC